MKKPELRGDMDHLLGLIYNKDEYVLPGEKRLKLKEGGEAWRKKKRADEAKIDHAIERAHKRAKTQRKYFLNNREKLNRDRALRNKQPEYAFYKCRKHAEQLDVPWEFTLEEWAALWEKAPKVVNPHNGFLVTAWSMKGQYSQRHTQMIRLDTKGAWNTNNCAIAYKGEVICYGNPETRTIVEGEDSELSWDVDTYLDRRDARTNG